MSEGKAWKGIRVHYASGNVWAWTSEAAFFLKATSGTTWVYVDPNVVEKTNVLSLDVDQITCDAIINVFYYTTGASGLLTVDYMYRVSILNSVPTWAYLRGTTSIPGVATNIVYCEEDMRIYTLSVRDDTTIHTKSVYHADIAGSIDNYISYIDFSTDTYGIYCIPLGTHDIICYMNDQNRILLYGDHVFPPGTINLTTPVKDPACIHINDSQNIMYLASKVKGLDNILVVKSITKIPYIIKATS